MDLPMHDCKGNRDTQRRHRRPQTPEQVIESETEKELLTYWRQYADSKDRRRQKKRSVNSNEFEQR